MNILLTGATGFIGRNITAALTGAGHRVVPVSRRHGVDFDRMLEPADWKPLLRSIDAVINCVGIIGETRRQRFEPIHALAPGALFQACASFGPRRVIQVSALGADDTAFSAYHLSKRRADDLLRSLDLDWFVLRPSLVYGRGSKSAALFMGLARLPRPPVIGNGQQWIQPIHIRDVVATVLQCLATRDTRQTIDLAGDETMTFADWLARMRQAQGLPPAAPLCIPVPLAMAAARATRHFHPLLQPENLRMLLRGYRADPARWVAFLGRQPLRIEDSLFFSDVVSAQEIPS